jgi:hypothetical protein
MRPALLLLTAAIQGVYSSTGPVPNFEGSTFNPNVEEYMSSEMTPDYGPEMSTVYQPGTPGAEWTEAEVHSTRVRLLQAIHGDLDVKKDMFGRGYDECDNCTKGFVSENALMRLVFHDCLRYTDGTGGCDGCLNHTNVGAPGPNPNKEADVFAFKPLNDTDNNGLTAIVEVLELIYMTVDWPWQEASLDASLYQLGKSRADFWQLAGLIALERTLERANRACDLDYHARQQVTLLESREACEVKLTAPLKFQTGRSDCVPDSNDPQGRKYAAAKAESHPRMFGDANDATDFFKNEFQMGAVHSTALQAIHGAVHVAHIGSKYTWFGGGYLSNIFFRMIANKPTYRFRNGGDLSFGAGQNIWKTAQGDKDGNPVAQTGWRASCMYSWDTPEGGPCFLRPTGAKSWDAPNPDKIIFDSCVLDVTSDGTCVIDTDEGPCANAYCDENLIEIGVEPDGAFAVVNGSWYDGVSDARVRHNTGWNNQFAFPWEIGAYWNLTSQEYSETSAQRAIGCPGLDDDFGTINPVETDFSPKWPYRNMGKSNIFASFAMQCSLNTYSPEGMPMHEIVDKLASDNEYWAEQFLEAWQIMTSNGNTGLTDGPQSSWLGHFSLTQQGVDVGDFDSYIADNAPVTFTDPARDPTICGHKGHFQTSCGLTFSKCYELFNTEGMCRGTGMGPGFW